MSALQQIRVSQITESKTTQAKQEMVDNSLRDYVCDADIAQAVDDCQALLCDREQVWTLDEKKDAALRFAEELFRNLENSMCGMDVKDYIKLNLG